MFPTSAGKKSSRRMPSFLCFLGTPLLQLSATPRPSQPRPRGQSRACALPQEQFRERSFPPPDCAKVPASQTAACVRACVRRCVRRCVRAVRSPGTAASPSPSAPALAPRRPPPLSARTPQRPPPAPSRPPLSQI